MRTAVGNYSCTERITMRADTEIQDRIRYLLTQEVDRRVSDSCARLPHNCRHNERHPLDVRKRVAGQSNPNYNQVSGKHLPVIGLCMLGSEDSATWPGNVCEDPIDAKRCPYFDPTSTKETVVGDFTQQIKDLDWVSENMPEVAGLLWALGSESLSPTPWWKVLWFRFLRPALPLGK
jgi:hypothetical protein